MTRRISELDLAAKTKNPPALTGRALKGFAGYARTTLAA